ncbi:hypothetical protein M422DRAFT_54954 [Sphaerobolus stellatus SS14]|uniref:Uncharacterized protein n=1 Tax=Sphaerobolus stellatus (strain SS14) TaxID=990650 RepID=A0A0C9U0W8_SPHS4|nr:hypothetical protein M422DRAFT_54954 [Sphaerobolus stellatus SS14]
MVVLCWKAKAGKMQQTCTCPCCSFTALLSNSLVLIREHTEGDTLKIMSGQSPGTETHGPETSPGSEKLQGALHSPIAGVVLLPTGSPVTPTAPTGPAEDPAVSSISPVSPAEPSKSLASQGDDSSVAPPTEKVILAVRRSKKPPSVVAASTKPQLPSVKVVSTKPPSVKVDSAKPPSIMAAPQEPIAESNTPSQATVIPAKARRGWKPAMEKAEAPRVQRVTRASGKVGPPPPTVAEE